MKYNPAITAAYFKQYLGEVPVPEYVFSPPRKWRFDFAWIKQKVALEVEGGVWIRGRHNRGGGFVKDMEKYNAASVLGWRILRVQPRDLMKYSTIAMVDDALQYSA